MTASTIQKPEVTIGTRHRQAFLLFFGLVVAYMQRVNLSMGIVAMTDKNSTGSVPILNYTTHEKGVISGMFYYGYSVAGPIFGVLTDKYGSTKLLAIVSGILCGIMTASTPLAAIYTSGIWAICTLRGLIGLLQGCVMPGVNTHLSNWATPQERGQFSWVFSGMQMGTILILAPAGELATSIGGWPSIFYMSGGASILWGLIFLVFGADNPNTHPAISEEERAYIVSNLKAKSTNKVSIPWKSLLTSIPFIALTIVHICHTWGYTTLLAMTPMYIHGVYGFSLNKNGFTSSLLYIGMFLGTIVFSSIADRLARKISHNFNRKFWNSVAMFGPAIALLVLSVFETNATGAVALLTVATTADGAHATGFLSNHVDLAPNLAGVLMGITNGLSNVASIYAPIFTTTIAEHEASASEWQTVFLVSAAIFFAGNILFLLLCSTEVQPWNECGDDTVKKRTTESVERQIKEHDQTTAASLD